MSDWRVYLCMAVLTFLHGLTIQRPTEAGHWFAAILIAALWPLWWLAVGVKMVVKAVRG